VVVVVVVVEVVVVVVVGLGFSSGGGEDELLCLKSKVSTPLSFPEMMRASTTREVVSSTRVCIDREYFL